MKENKVGKIIDSNEPMKGMKLRKNANIPNVGARSLFMKKRIIKVMAPIRALVKVFI